MGKLYHLYHRGLTTRFLTLVLLISGATCSLSLYVFLNLSDYISGTQKLGVHFLNIGQGDAIYIQAPNKNSILIDSGPQNEKVIAEVQQFKNIFDRRIDVLLATHADADHIGSMKKVIEKFQYQKFAYSGLTSETKLFQDLIKQVDQVETDRNKKLVLTAGMSIILDEEKDIRFDILFPDFNFQIGGYKTCKSTQQNKIKKSNSKDKLENESKYKKDSCLKFLSTETNLNSVVGKLSYGSTSFMLTGDDPIEVENFIIKKNKIEQKIEQSQSFGYLKTVPTIQSVDLDTDVLKLGHHGSKTSTSAEFVKALSPNFAIVSAGKDNRYGHPHKIVLDRLDEYRNSYNSILQILRTDRDGTINFYSDGIRLLRE